MPVWSRVRQRLDDLVSRLGGMDAPRDIITPSSAPAPDAPAPRVPPPPVAHADAVAHENGAFTGATAQQLDATAAAPSMADRAAEALERLSRQHERILNAAGEGIYEIDDRGQTRFVNPAAARLLGWDPPALIGRPVHDVLHADIPVDEDICPIHTALVYGVDSYVKDDLFSTRDGTTFPVEYICTPITERDRIVGAVITFQNIAERRLIEAEIVRLRDMALESARMRSEFLANMSHEIRTPLNGIIGMTGILLDTDLSAEQRRSAAIIKTSADALLTIVNDILDFSRIESGKMRFETLDFDLLDVVESTTESFAERAHAKGLRLVASVAPDVVTAVRGDPGRLRQVLTNLLGNALKFTERGEVVLRVTRESGPIPGSGAGPTAGPGSGSGSGSGFNSGFSSGPGPEATLRVEVQDTGIGISPVQQAHLFQPFVQADSSTTRMYGGTGLGLAISKQIVEQMGGTIGVESDSGLGARFWFTLTLAQQPGATARVPGAGAERGGEGSRPPVGLAAAAGVGRDRPSVPSAQPPLSSPGGGAASPIAPPPPNGQQFSQPISPQVGAPIGPRLVPQASRRPRILVAEDNIVNQQVALQQLHKLGYTADAVANGYEALEALTRIQYDLVLMDCQMPDLDGYDATRELRRREGASTHTPVIAMTAYALPSDRQLCLEAGMDDYVAKPVTLAHLKTIVHNYLREPEEAAGERVSPLPPALVGAIDGAMWQSLHAMQAEHGGDFVHATITLYLEYATACFDTLRRALAAHDLDALARAAHSLKGSSSILGLSTIANLSAELAQTGAQDAPLEAPRILQRLEQEFQRVKGAVESQLSSSGLPGVVERRT